MFERALDIINICHIIWQKEISVKWYVAIEFLHSLWNVLLHVSLSDDNDGLVQERYNSIQWLLTVDETASHDQVAHKIGCLYIPLLF